MKHFLAIVHTKPVREIISATDLTPAEIQAQKESIAALRGIDPDAVRIVEERRRFKTSKETAA